MKYVTAPLLRRASRAALALVFALPSLATTAAHGQAYPSFPNSLKNSALLHRTSATVGASPALVTVGTGIGVAYADQSSGDLYFAKVSGGLTIGTPVGVGVHIGADNTPAAANVNGILYLAYILNGYIYTVQSANQGVSWQGPYLISGSPVPVGRPSMTVINGSIFLAYRSGSFIYYMTGNGTSFGTPNLIPAGHPAPISNPSVSPSQTSGGAVITWIDAANHPVSAVFNPGNLTTPATVTEITGILLGGDPAPILINGLLYIFGRSYYSADNLWAIQTDGVNSAPQMEYGQTLTNSPSLIVDPNNGNLVTQMGRSNFGSNIWAYSGH